jgi:hypothetical protein
MAWRDNFWLPDLGSRSTISKFANESGGGDLPHALFAEKPAGRFMIRNRTRVVKRHPEGDW